MLKICKKLQEKRFVFVKILAIIIPENGAKVSKIKCLRLNQQTLFTSRLDTTYSRFLTGVKISHAMALLVNTNLTITAIAGQCGYDNSNYFSDAFKKIVGVSPLKYRKQINK